MDLAVAHRMAMEYISQKESINLVLNIGRGESNSILDLINSFERVNKIKVNYEFTDRRKGDNAVSLVSTENMLNIFKHQLIQKHFDWLYSRYKVVDNHRINWDKIFYKKAYHNE